MIQSVQRILRMKLGGRRKTLAMNFCCGQKWWWQIQCFCLSSHSCALCPAFLPDCGPFLLHNSSPRTISRHQAVLTMQTTLSHRLYSMTLVDGYNCLSAHPCLFTLLGASEKLVDGLFVSPILIANHSTLPLPELCLHWHMAPPIVNTFPSDTQGVHAALNWRCKWCISLRRFTFCFTVKTGTKWLWKEMKWSFIKW